MPSSSQPEPWLRGILPDVDPVMGHLIRAAEQICEDSARALEPLTTEEVWERPCGITSAGFHAKHLAGSTQRLSTYLAGDSLDAAALQAMSNEGIGTESPEELRAGIYRAFAHYADLVRGLPADEFSSLRRVGRKRLPVTAIGLAIHIAEHGQRHTGQLVTTAKLVTTCRVDKMQVPL